MLKRSFGLFWKPAYPVSILCRTPQALYDRARRRMSAISPMTFRIPQGQVAFTRAQGMEVLGVSCPAPGLDAFGSGEKVGACAVTEGWLRLRLARGPSTDRSAAA